MNLITPATTQEIIAKDYTFFLAGSIEKNQSENWRKYFIDQFTNEAVNIVNPELQNGYEQNLTAATNWELDWLNHSDYIVVYLGADSKSGTSLIELGLYAKKHKVLVYCEPGFWKKDYLEALCQKYNIVQFTSFDALIAYAKGKIAFGRKSISVFGGGGGAVTPEYTETVEIGKLCAKYGYNVITGGYGGIMEAGPKGAKAHSGPSTGILCRQVNNKPGNDYLTEKKITDNLYDRLELLIKYSNLFIIQRGGIGTLAEVFLALDVLRKRPEIKTPKVVFYGKYWQSHIDIINQLVPPHEQFLYTVETELAGLENRIKTLIY